MRIRWVTWWPAPYWTSRFNFLSLQENVELEVIFLYSQSGIHEWEIDTRSWNFPFKFIKVGHNNYGYYNYIEKLKLKNPLPLVIGKYDILVTQYADFSCIIAMLLSKIMNKPYYLFAANTIYENRKKSVFFEFLKTIIFRSSSGVLATGPMQFEYSQKYIKDPKKISIIGNPVNLGGYKYSQQNINKIKLRNEFRWGSNQIILLYVGRLSEDKGLIDLLSAVEKLNCYKYNLRLVMIGSGPLKSEIKEFAKIRNINIELTGYLSQQEIVKRYCASDIFILPSLSEAWGLVVNEAMECGLPIILSNRVGCGSVLLKEGTNGYIFQAGNSDQLSNCIKNLCENTSLREIMSLNSMEIIKEHTIENWAKAVIQALM